MAMIAKFEGLLSNKKFVYGLIGALVVFLALSIFLWISFSNTSKERDNLTQALTELVVFSHQTSDTLAAREADLATLQQEYLALQGERDQLSSEKQQLEETASLYQTQKYFFADALNWIGRLYGYTDLDTLAFDYSQISHKNLPETCESETVARYEGWSAPSSTMFVVTPDKMGWPNYGWSIRENVTFGPDHLPDPGYVGSRGYELRYPLTGTYPLQEVHTTINVYESEVPQDYWSGREAVETVSLNCGVEAFITIADDPEKTKTIYFVFGDFGINVKLKYFFGEQSQAFTYLTQAANIVIDGLTAGW